MSASVTTAIRAIDRRAVRERRGAATRGSSQTAVDEGDRAERRPHAARRTRCPSDRLGHADDRGRDRDGADEQRELPLTHVGARISGPRVALGEVG